MSFFTFKIMKFFLIKVLCLYWMFRNVLGIDITDTKRKWKRFSFLSLAVTASIACLFKELKIELNLIIFFPEEFRACFLIQPITFSDFLTSPSTIFISNIHIFWTIHVFPSQCHPPFYFSSLILKATVLPHSAVLSFNYASTFWNYPIIIFQKYVIN